MLKSRCLGGGGKMERTNEPLPPSWVIGYDILSVVIVIILIIVKTVVKLEINHARIGSGKDCVAALMRESI